jgi:hypothetical protein
MNRYYIYYALQEYQLLLFSDMFAENWKYANEIWCLKLLLQSVDIFQLLYKAIPVQMRQIVNICRQTQQ